MKIGIIGSGRIGGTLARLLTQAGHEVGLSHAHGTGTLRDEVTAMGANACAMTVEEAARFGDVVVAAIPFGSFRDVPVDALRDKVVVDAMNYYPQRDGHIPDLDRHVSTSSELFQRHLSGARVVKAFNTIRFDVLANEGQPPGEQRVAIPVAGDDEGAKGVVMGLIDEIGFDPVDAGGLAGSDRLEPGAPAYAAHADVEETRRLLVA